MCRFVSASFLCLQHFVVACVLRVVGSASFMYVGLFATFGRCCTFALTGHRTTRPLYETDFPDTVQCDDFCTDTVQSDNLFLMLFSVTT